MTEKWIVLVLPLVLLLGVTQAEDQAVQPEASVAPKIEENVTTVERVGTPHAGLTEAEKAKRENPVMVSPEESEKVRMPDRPQAEPKAVEATGKRARPVELEPGFSTILGSKDTYPGMTEEELEKLNQEPVPTSNSDGIDNAGKELIPTDRTPEYPH